MCYASFMAISYATTDLTKYITSFLDQKAATMSQVSGKISIMGHLLHKETKFISFFNPIGLYNVIVSELKDYILLTREPFSACSDR